MALGFSLSSQVVICFTFMAIQLPTAVIKKTTNTHTKRNKKKLKNQKQNKIKKNPNKPHKQKTPQNPKPTQNKDTTLSKQANKTPQRRPSKGNSCISYVTNPCFQPLLTQHFLHH